jgi:FKBP-type peptidyl-prolyl cis-trans isomerase
MRLKKSMCACGILLLATQALAEESALKTHRDRSSYAVGVNLAGNMKQQGVETDPDLVIKGMRDALAGGKLLMTDEDIRKYIGFYQSEVRNKQARLRSAAAEENKKAGAAFLLANARREGVVTLPSGLQYSVLKTGDGKRPTDADTVEFHYRSASIRGTEYESSYRTDRPATGKLMGGVVPGLAEALRLMPVGSIWQLYIPSKLAYGERGSGSVVGPNETVLFEVALLAIK